jgi:hypothetical protein
MVDFNPAYKEAFENACRNMGMSAEQTTRGLSDLNNRISQSNSRMTAIGNALNSAAGNARAQGAAASIAAAELKKAASSMRASGATTEQVRREMESLANTIANEINDPKLRASIKQYADAQVNAAERTQAYQQVLSVASRGGAALTNIISTYQSGSSQIGTSSVLMQEAIGGVGSVLQGLGTAASSAGQGLGLLAKTVPGMVISLGLIGLGEAAKLVGRTLTEAAAKVLPLLQRQIELNISAFQGLSSSGALFANGLHNMIGAAGLAGLSLTQLDVIVKANKEIFGTLGEGVSSGVNRLARVFDQTNPVAVKFRKDLLNLGYTVEEQAGLVAETMKDMRQSSKPLANTPEMTDRIRQETQKYAENLRIISAITGEDAKAKMAQARQAAAELAFQQSMQAKGMSAEQQADMIQAMGSMSAIQQKAFKEMVVFGTTVSQDTAAFMSQSPESAAALQESVDAYNSGQLTANRQLEINAQHAEGIRQDMLSNVGIAQAGMIGVGGLVDGLKSAMQDELQFRQKWTADAIAQSRTQVLGQELPEQMERGRGEAQTAMTGLILQNQNLNAELSKVTASAGVLTTYSNMAAKAALMLKEGLETLLGSRVFASTPEQAQREREQQRDLEDQQEGELRSQAATVRANPVPNTYPPGQGPGTPGFVPQPGDIVGSQLDRLRQQTPPVNASSPMPVTIVDPRTGQPAAMPSVTPSTTVNPQQNQSGTQTPNQQINPNNTSNRTGDLATPEGQRALAENFWNGGARSLPNGPTTNETDQERQNRTAAESRQAIDNADETRAPIERAQLARQQQAEANNPVIRSLDQVASNIDSLRALMEDSLRHLENIDTHTNHVALNT